MIANQNTGSAVPRIDVPRISLVASDLGRQAAAMPMITPSTAQTRKLYTTSSRVAGTAALSCGPTGLRLT
jgi:hypothetical protein